MKYGLSAKTRSSVEAVFLKHPKIEKVILYGSRAKGTHHEGSDIDLTLVGDDLELTDLYAVDEDLDELNLPYTIDLSLYGQIDSEGLIGHIERRGEVFYQKAKNIKEKWKSQKIADIITPSGTRDPRKLSDKVFNYVDVSSISNETLRIIETQKLLGRDAPSRARRVIKAGDIIFATVRPTLKRIAIVPENLHNQICSTGYFIFRAKEGIHNKFLFYFLQTEFFMGQMERLQTGASYPAVNDTQVKQQLISYPSVNEQKRIVAILELAFAEIEKARANAEQNLKNARELFESYLQQVFSQSGDGWVEARLGKLCKKMEYGTSSRSTKEGMVPVLRMGNIQNGKIDWNDLKYTDDFEEIKKYNLEKGDVIFNRTNSAEHVGKTAIYEGEQPAIFAGYLIRIHRKKDLLNAVFLNYYLNSSFARNYGKTVMSSSVNQSNINGTKLKNYPISAPEISVQKIIVKEIKLLEIQVLKLEKNYQNKLKALDELKKSILQKAFTGKLTKETAT
jgi:type I restriction enzyme S subunit